jgi:hypothetical protein
MDSPLNELIRGACRNLTRQQLCKNSVINQSVTTIVSEGIVNDLPISPKYINTNTNNVSVADTASTSNTKHPKTNAALGDKKCELNSESGSGWGKVGLKISKWFSPPPEWTDAVNVMGNVRPKLAPSVSELFGKFVSQLSLKSSSQVSSAQGLPKTLPPKPGRSLWQTLHARFFHAPQRTAYTGMDVWPESLCHGGWSWQI